MGSVNVVEPSDAALDTEVRVVVLADLLSGKLLQSVCILRLKKRKIK
jgi:hypothetical protein